MGECHLCSVMMSILIILLCLCFAYGRNPPHIILILADDLGWNDVSFHGCNQIPTPNIDALAYNGIILNQHYSLSLCTPSRAALLTGKYPIHTGMQHYVIVESEPSGLGLSEILFPQILSKAGYKTHMVGKWHLGYHRKAYTPTYRGFDSHFGFWLSHQNYYNHLLTSNLHYGYDMRRGLNTDWSAYGHYSTDIFTSESIRLITNHNKSHPFFLYLSHAAPHSGNPDEPYQAPQDVVDRFSYIEDPERQKYAAMVAKLDESVGDVVASLAKNEMLDNSVIIFLSDNGAPTYGMHNNKGSNFPFKGMKSSAWEGGHRSVAAVWSPLIEKPKRVSNHLMHITDWLPTLYSLTGDETQNIMNIDGINTWDSISKDSPSPRNEMLYNIDDLESPYVAFRSGDWKYVSGYQKGSLQWSDWYGLFNTTAVIDYHPESVVLSKTGTSISKLNMKNVLKYAIDNRNTSVKKEEEMLTRMMLHRDTILKLRDEARIECKNMKKTTCDPLKNPCIFNLKDDPCEYNNLAAEQRNILQNMEESIKRYRKNIVLPRNKPRDCRCNPAFWNHTYTNWSDELDKPEFQNITCM